MSRNLQQGIAYPREHAEFEIQAALFIALRKRHINVRGEVHGCMDDKGGIFDLVVFDLINEPRILIEVKQANKPVLAPQHTWYASFRLPVLYCIGKHEIKQTIEKVMEMVPQFRLRALLPIPGTFGRLKCKHCDFHATNPTLIQRHVGDMHPDEWRQVMRQSYRHANGLK